MLSTACNDFLSNETAFSAYQLELFRGEHRAWLHAFGCVRAFVEKEKNSKGGKNGCQCIM